MENKKLTTSLVASLLIATNLFSQELSTITVTSATKSEQSIKDVTSNVEVITKEEIEERHFTTVTEALNTLSGISFASSGGMGNSISVFVRGMSTNRTLVLIDGVRYQDPSNTSGAALQHLMINDIERIELIKGAQSGIWGADASAGVINIITEQATKGTRGNVTIEAGSFNTKKYAATLSHGEENFDVKFSANRIESDGFTSQSPKGDDIDKYEDDGYDNTTLSFDTNYYFNNKTKISFGIKNIDAQADYDDSGADDEDMQSDINTTLYNASISHKIKNHDFKLKYEFSRFKKHEIGTVGSGWGENIIRYKGKSQNIELYDNIKYMKDSFFITGIGHTEDNVNYTLTDDTKNDDNTDSKYVYITNSNKFNNLILTQSLRYDDYNEHDSQTTGKIGVKYFLNDDISFSSNYGTAYNVPSIIKQLNPWGTENLDLEPEEIKSFDLGFVYRNFSATYFYNKVKNLIAWEGLGYNNIEGESILKGFELSYKKEIFNDLLLNLNYTKLNAEKDNGEYLKRRPKDEIKASFDYYGFKNIHLNLNAQYVGERYDKDDEKGEQTGKYTVWNSVINYEINKDFSTYLKLDNIFNKYYQTSYGYATAPRSAYIGLKYKF